MSDYSFMQTGFSNETIPSEEIINLASIFMIFTEDALKISGIYTIHGGRKVVTTKDIVKALKIRTIHNDTFWNLPNTKERLEKMVKNLNETEESESEDEMGEEINEEDNSIICNCYVCSLFHTVDADWRVWVPSNVQENSLKKRIDEM
jgi:3'-phosphoadenosine 5'-phosphosulfate sulfotransferase (PAPS reductase)/FAD synthetase